MSPHWRGVIVTSTRMIYVIQSIIVRWIIYIVHNEKKDIGERNASSLVSKTPFVIANTFPTLKSEHIQYQTADITEDVPKASDKHFPRLREALSPLNCQQVDKCAFIVLGYSHTLNAPCFRRATILRTCVYAIFVRAFSKCYIEDLTSVFNT